MRARELLAELKRRRVVRVAAVYGAAAFAVLQAADILVPALHLPGWTIGFLVVLLAVGFVIALALSWVLEVTADGIRRTAAADAAAADATTQLLGGRTLFVAASLLLAGVAFGTGWVLGPDSRDGTHTDHRVSVAVLPFADLSDDRSQEYLGDGIAEELLNMLVRSEEVVVASRTSSFSFKGRSLALPAIARELNVEHVIDGSVRRAGNRLRITAQLVDAHADRPLWSQSFDRTADDILSVQDEIARAIASALRVRLAGGVSPPAGTNDPEAYDLYLLGLYHWNQRTAEGLLHARDIFTAATQRDPSYARAWAGLSLTYRNLPGYAEFDPATARREALAAAERAVQLDPLSAEARTALGGALWYVQDRAGAQRELERAIQLDSTFATAHHWLGILHSTAGRLTQGEAVLRRAHALDPAAPAIQSYLGLNLDMQRRTEEALAVVDALLIRAPDYRNGLIQAFQYGATLGRPREVEYRLAGWLRAIGEDPAAAAVVVDGLAVPERRAAAVATVEAIAGRRRGAGLDMQLATLFALLGAAEQAVTLLTEWRDEPPTYARVPAFDLIRDDPRMQALLDGRSPGPVPTVRTP